MSVATDTLPSWGLSDIQLATAPLAYAPDLFAGQSVLISGGGSGIGRAMAYLYARLGARVMICGRRLERLEETAEGIREHLGREVLCHAMTIRDPQAVQALFDEAWSRFGGLDHLVNNGGGQFPQDALDFSVKGWNAVIDTNLNGPFWMMQAAARRWLDEHPDVRRAWLAGVTRAVFQRNFPSALPSATMNGSSLPSLSFSAP